MFAVMYGKKFYIHRSREDAEPGTERNSKDDFIALKYNSCHIQ